MDFMARLKRVAEKLGYWFNWVAGAGLVGMMLLTCSDVVLRFFDRPVPGTFEIVGFLGVIVAAFAIAYTHILGGHVAIDYLVARLPQRSRNAFRSLVSLLGASLFALIAWQSCLFARSLSISGEVSPTEKIPISPFVYSIAVACLPVILVLSVDFIRSLGQMVKK